MENIYLKLLEIQKKIKGLSKDKKSHNYEYVTGNKLLSFIKPLMDEYGLILKQEIISIDNDRQDYKVWDKWVKNTDGTQGQWKPKAEVLSKVMMKFTWIDCVTGEKDENLFGANGQNDWEKGLGSALTYAERYFLLKYFHIPTDKDDIDNPDRKDDRSLSYESKSNVSSDKDKGVWLNENDVNWKQIKSHVEGGGKYSIESAKKKYRLTKATEKKLNELLTLKKSA